jgi:O-antigen/teichoic acid export membrane protein
VQDLRDSSRFDAAAGTPPAVHRAFERIDGSMPKLSFSMLARNWSWSGIASLWWLGSRLFLTPFVLERISVDGYGVWSLLFALPATISVIDASFGQAYVKLTAEHEAKGDREGLSRLLGAGMALVGSIGAAGLAVVWLTRTWTLPWLQIPDRLLEPAGNALLLICITVVLQMSIGNVRQVLTGLQRADLTNKAAILSSVINFVLSLWLLSLGWGLEGLALSFLTGEVVAIGLVRLWLHRLTPGLHLSPFRATRESMRTVISLGARFQGLYFLTQWTTNGFRMLLSGLLGPEVVGYFELAHRLLNLGELGANIVYTPMMPLFAQLHSERDAGSARSLYRMGTRLMFAVSLLSYGFLFAFADTALGVWTGQSFDAATWTVRALSVAFLAKTLTAMGTAELRAKGAFRLEYQYTVLNVGLRIALVAPLYLLFSYEGFVLAGSCALTLSSMWFFYRFHRDQGLALQPVIVEAILRPVAAVIPIVVASQLLVTRFPFPNLEMISRWRLGGELVLAALAFGGLGLLAIWKFSLAADEQQDLARRLRGIAS